LLLVSLLIGLHIIEGL
jgi:hypothetical protein